MEFESDLDLTGGIVFEEETCENGGGVAVYVQAVPSTGELGTLDATRGDTTPPDSMEDPLSLSNFAGIKQGHGLPDSITIKQEHPWTEQTNSKEDVSAEYSIAGEEDVSADLGKDESLIVNVGDSAAVKIEIIENEIDAVPSWAGKDEQLDVKAEESAVKLEIIENEINAEPSSSGDADCRQCQHCNYTCLRQIVLERHVRNRHGHVGRSGKYKCGKCAYLTDRSSNMRRHQGTHTGERPFPCEKCDEAFSQLSHLRRHIQTVHDRLKPHSCSVCGKAYALSGDLTTHQRIHSGTSVVQCKRCGKQFNNRSIYTRHMKSHDGVKAHKCQVCSARFVRRQDLTRHMRTHTGERPYSCLHCNATFSVRGHMKNHVVAAHTHDYKHRCERCGKGFIKPGDLRKHSDKCSV